MWSVFGKIPPASQFVKLPVNAQPFLWALTSLAGLHIRLHSWDGDQNRGHGPVQLLQGENSRVTSYLSMVSTKVMFCSPVPLYHALRWAGMSLSASLSSSAWWNWPSPMSAVCLCFGFSVRSVSHHRPTHTVVHSSAPVSPAWLTIYSAVHLFVSSPVFLCVSLPLCLYLFPCCLLTSVSFWRSPQLRLFRLARWWHWFQVFLQITLKYSLLLLIVFFGFVVVGYQLFAEDYSNSVCKLSSDCELPRWHMTKFFPSFLVVFRVFTGSWSEVLWDCMEVSGPASCLTFVLSAVVVGNLLVSLCR